MQVSGKKPRTDRNVNPCHAVVMLIFYVRYTSPYMYVDVKQNMIGGIAEGHALDLDDISTILKRRE